MIRHAPATRSLARHIFFRVAFPVGILFLSCFILLDRLLQDQLRTHIRQELQEKDLQLNRAQLAGDERLRKSLAALASASGTASALRRPEAQARAILAKQVSQFGSFLDEDLYAIAGQNRKPIVALRREANDLRSLNLTAAAPDHRVLREIDGQFYFLNSHPIVTDGVPAGWIVTGRHWLREVPEGPVVLARDGKVVQVGGTQTPPQLAVGSPLPECAGQVADCELELQGNRHLLLRSVGADAASGLDIYLVSSFELAANQLLGMTRFIMLGGALFSILGAFGLALLTSRAVSTPLKDITRSFAGAKEAGHLTDIEIPRSRIAEVNALAQTLREAVRGIDEGQSKLTQAYFQFMGTIVALLDARDAYTAGHSHRVSAYSEALARDYGLPANEVDDIRVGALLHDIGKIGVPDEVLQKHERLTKEEFDLMKQHPTIGRNVLERVANFERYLDAVELHHENLDGTGYPRGLRGNQIPISARIVKVADVYDALSTDRPYRKRLAPEEVHDILRKGSGNHFDRLLVEIFLTRCVPRFEQHASLASLHRAVEGERKAIPAKKAVGA